MLATFEFEFHDLQGEQAFEPTPYAKMIQTTSRSYRLSDKSVDEKTLIRNQQKQQPEIKNAAKPASRLRR